MKKIEISQLQINPMELIAKQWMLITAGDERGYNTMTASWGHLGSIWGHGGGMPTSVIFVRPQRYTKEFIDRENLYTLCFFPEEYRKALVHLGRNSGRDGDKVAQSGLTPVFADGYTYFAEAELVMVCRKLYRGTLTEDGFVDSSVATEHYPNKDFHDMYIGEILEVYQKD